MSFYLWCYDNEGCRLLYEERRADIWFWTDGPDTTTLFPTREEARAKADALTAARRKSGDWEAPLVRVGARGGQTP